MSRHNKGRLAPFVPMLKETMKTEAWRALSYGARALYMALKGRYNTKLQGSVYLSTRDAVKELSLHQHRTNAMKWYRELQYYGFIVMVGLPHHGVGGHGRAAHYRLTEQWYLGKPPTRDFLNWDGVMFQEQKSAKHYQRKNKSRGTHGRTTLVRTGVPVAAQPEPEMPESGTDGRTMSKDGTGTDGRTITSSTTPCVNADDDTSLHPRLEWSTPQIVEVFGYLPLWSDSALAHMPDQLGYLVRLAACSTRH